MGSETGSGQGPSVQRGGVQCRLLQSLLRCPAPTCAKLTCPRDCPSLQGVNYAPSCQATPAWPSCGHPTGHRLGLVRRERDGEEAGERRKPRTVKGAEDTLALDTRTPALALHPWEKSGTLFKPTLPPCLGAPLVPRTSGAGLATDNWWSPKSGQGASEPGGHSRHRTQPRAWGPAVGAWADSGELRFRASPLGGL